VDKAGFSGKQQKVSAPSIEDIPEALRDNHHAPNQAPYETGFDWGSVIKCDCP